MPQLYHKHDIQTRIAYSAGTQSHNWNKTITRSINSSPNLWLLNSQGYFQSPYPGYAGNLTTPYTGGFYENISDSYIQPGYLYPGYRKNSTGTPTYITGTKWLAILDVFKIQRYTVLSTSTFWGFPQVNPYYTVAYDNWVAWAIYDTATGQFTGNYCTGNTSARLKFNLTPLDSFADVVSQFNIKSSTTFQQLTGTSAPTAAFSTSFFTLKSGSTLSASGQSIRINAGHPTNQFTIQGSNMRFHGFLSYSGVFSTTTYAFVTFRTSDTVKHVGRNTQYGGSKYPERNTQDITHNVIPMCRLTSGTGVAVGTHTSNITNVFYSMNGGDGFTGGGLTPVTNLASLHPNPSESSTVLDNNLAPIEVPNWMTENIIKSETAIYLESDGGNVDYFDTGYYGTDTVYAFWDLDTQTWTGYTDYSGGGGGPTVYRYSITNPLDSPDPNMICGMVDHNSIPYPNVVFSTSSSLTQNDILYIDQAMSSAFDGMNQWYYIADAYGIPLFPKVTYLIDPSGNIATAWNCK
jgi:hypothetical protein